MSLDAIHEREVSRVRYRRRRGRLCHRLGHRHPWTKRPTLPLRDRHLHGPGHPHGVLVSTFPEEGRLSRLGYGLFSDRFGLCLVSDLGSATWSCLVRSGSLFFVYLRSAIFFSGHEVNGIFLSVRRRLLLGRPFVPVRLEG